MKGREGLIVKGQNEGSFVIGKKWCPLNLLTFFFFLTSPDLGNAKQKKTQSSPSPGREGAPPGGGDSDPLCPARVSPGPPRAPGSALLNSFRLLHPVLAQAGPGGPRGPCSRSPCCPGDAPAPHSQLLPYRQGRAPGHPAAAQWNPGGAGAGSGSVSTAEGQGTGENRSGRTTKGGDAVKTVTPHQGASP